MFNLGFPEIVLISAIVLLIFGPKRLPELAKGLGKGIREFKKALSQTEEDEQKPAITQNSEQDPNKKT
ncbi:MAG: twin-arginine translocase TatA/TatE family subunit [Proteobacteria bacterium]|nr:twin-arginine translocase TatA/TatE family subunit [Pseudomonadota bacterium]NDC23053.1 twin-arginine translocase TatA/TatE family subunit [Pseudomonadota bacterium]NDD03720.1 twin-arginine translocase TatA/TatE family subunit [Pseudomonadota bacterium]NDG25642.1 twin-arginine translocase TatA/TatE family subunit [Pseudomonadota bacterium]